MRAFLDISPSVRLLLGFLWPFSSDQPVSFIGKSASSLLLLSGENSIQDQDVLSAALYPKVFKDYMLFKEEFGPVHGLPTRLFFTGPDIGEEFQVELQPGKVLNIKVLAISDLHPNGQREVFCEMNGQLRTVMVEDKSVTKVLTRVLTILRKTS